MTGATAAQQNMGVLTLMTGVAGDGHLQVVGAKAGAGFG